MRSVDIKQQSRKRLTALEDGGIAKLIGDCWRDGGRVRRRVSQFGESSATTSDKVGSSMVLVEVDRGELPLAPRQPREARGRRLWSEEGGGDESSPAQQLGMKYLDTPFSCRAATASDVDRSIKIQWMRIASDVVE